MKNKDENAPVEVYSGTTLQAEMVKSLLENAEIEAFLNDEIVGTLSPWWTAPGGAGSVKVVVATKDFDIAKSIVAEYESNIMP
jgi:hypothetical protein